MTSSTRYCYAVMYYVAHACYNRQFLFAQRFELRHIFYVILHLPNCGHAAKYHEYSGQRSRITNCPRSRRTPRTVLLQYLFCLFRYIGKHTALYRLHYNYGLFMFGCYVVAFTCLYRCIVPIQIVYLQLNEFRLRMVLHNPFEQRTVVMKRKTYVPDFPFCFFSRNKLKSMKFLCVLIIFLIKRMY